MRDVTAKTTIDYKKSEKSRYSCDQLYIGDELYMHMLCDFPHLTQSALSAISLTMMLDLTHAC